MPLRPGAGYCAALAQALPFQCGPAHSIADVAARFEGAGGTRRTGGHIASFRGNPEATLQLQTTAVFRAEALHLVLESNRALAEETLGGARVIRKPLRLGAGGRAVGVHTAAN